MVRILTLILGVSFCFLSQAAAESQVSQNHLIMDSTISRPVSLRQNLFLHAKNFDQQQTKLNSANSLPETRQRKKAEPGIRNDKRFSRNVSDSVNSDAPGQGKVYVVGPSIFDIRIPGDPRSRFDLKPEDWNHSQKTASWSGRQKNDEAPIPGTILKKLGSIPNPAISFQEDRIQRLEIQVSHSTHVFKLIAHTGGADTQILYECKIGLGAPEFPTPVGTYYVTHIYDQDPWWIPPPNRAWAAGDSPSKRVYGGTMAPLLKKRTPTTRKKDVAPSEDRIEGAVKLEDYGYRFHGTNAPRSIGRNQSHGCVRMISDDAKKVASIIEDYVGIAERKESENGSYAILKAPVRLNLLK
jgi:L,D-transpeptidase catalytic domain